MPSISDYNFPDSALLASDGSPGRCLVWTPPYLAVVIGKGSKPEEEVNLEACERDHVEIVRRGTGGCAVVISPEMLVVTFALYTEKQRQSKEYFKLFNRIIISALESQGIRNLSHQGISDIALGDKKIAGTAIYRKRDLVFYHAILNVSSSPDLMERCLKYPPRTPDYRRQRSHVDFVTSLMKAGISLDETAFVRAVEAEFAKLIE